jgi:hypothetical protein
MPKRNKAIAIIMMPLAIFLWVIGWSLFQAGSKKEPRRQQVEPPIKKELTFIVQIPEQLQHAT